MTNRDRQAQATKQKLVDSAKRLIGENGFDNVTVDAIVADCGVAKGTFYHYFKSKEDLTVCLSSVVYDELEAQEVQMEALPLKEGLSWFITNWYQDVNTYNLHFARQSLKLYTQSAEGDENGFVSSHMVRGIQMVRNLLMAAVNRGELKLETPVDVLAMGIMFAMQGSTLYHCRYGDQFDVMGWCDDFIHVIVSALVQPYVTNADS